jgi:glycosyltransferase involved in cell wall biosynthesis
MRIGVLSAGTPDSGGMYQYGATMLQALQQYAKNGCRDEFIVYEPEPASADLVSANGRNWTSQTLPLAEPLSLGQRALAIARRGVGEGPHRDAWRRLRKAIRKPLDFNKIRRRDHISEQFRREGVGLMLYPAPNSLAFETDVPYMMPIHDLQHRLQPEFPEVSANGEWEKREYIFRNGARYATILLADSEVGKEDILNFYEPHGVTSDQVRVLPFLPSCYLSLHVSDTERKRVRAAFQLPERYLFYPAQFWPHKNHERIIRALSLLKEVRRLEIPIVFCGSHSGVIRERNFKQVMTVAAKLGIEGNVRYLGYVSDSEISALYAEATALVMPTFFGPTNIPVVEAWAMGCPVLTSDIRGIREQVRDAAILADPKSVESIADGIAQTLVCRGRERLAGYTEADYQRRLIEALEQAKLLRAERNGNAVGF